ncbi:MAG: hypothetical protein AAF389_11445 [Gemmatimonadota bacterium]
MRRRGRIASILADRSGFTVGYSRNRLVRFLLPSDWRDDAFAVGDIVEWDTLGERRQAILNRSRSRILSAFVVPAEEIAKRG